MKTDPEKGGLALMSRRKEEADIDNVGYSRGKTLRKIVKLISGQGIEVVVTQVGMYQLKVETTGRRIRKLRLSHPTNMARK